MDTLEGYLNLLEEISDLSETDAYNYAKKIENSGEFLFFLEHYGIGASYPPALQHYLSTFFVLYEIQKKYGNQLDQISINHQNTIINVFERTVLPALEQILPKQIHFLAVQKNTTEKLELRSVNELCLIIRILNDLFELKFLAMNGLLESVAIQYVASIFYCIFALSKTDPRIETCENCLRKIHQRFGTLNTFRFYLIVKGMHHMPKEISIRVHKELLKQLRKPGGFAIFCQILMAREENAEHPNWERYQSIAKIVGAKGYTKSYYTFIVQDIIIFLQHSLLNESDKKFIQPSVVCLKQIFSLDPEGEVSKEMMNHLFKTTLDELVEPADVISGVIVVEGDQFQLALQMLCAVFNGSIDKSTFPSVLLIPYAPLLFQTLVLLDKLDEGDQMLKHLCYLLCLCLQNRNDDELCELLPKILFPSDEVNQLHPRIDVKTTATGVHFQIVTEIRDAYNLSISLVLVKMLKSSNNNLLIYKTFISLLKILRLQLQRKIRSAPATASALLCHEEDTIIIEQRINEMFFERTIVVKIICDLLAFKKFHSQFKEHPTDIIEFGQGILEHNIELLCKNSSMIENEDSVTDIVLTIFNEFSNLLRTAQPEIGKVLREYQRLNRNERIASQLDQLLQNLEGTATLQKSSDSKFNEAMALCTNKSPPIIVEGIDKIIKLIEKRNPEAVAFRHKVLANTLDNLKDAESYVYLNSILLLVALVKIMESEVVEALIDEFVNSNSDIELRLKVGEVLVKVLESMGPLTYKYKDMLINTFLRNCQAPFPLEFRTSCTVNLGTVAKILSYQVHSYFYELMNHIENVFDTEQYIQLRRASVLVLSQLVSGMVNLVDLGDHVLEVYRFLKKIISTETDEKTNLHAAIALETLKIKTKEFLTPNHDLAKKIRVLGISEETKIEEIKYK